MLALRKSRTSINFDRAHHLALNLMDSSNVYQRSCIFIVMQMDDYLNISYFIAQKRVRVWFSIHECIHTIVCYRLALSRQLCLILYELILRLEVIAYVSAICVGVTYCSPSVCAHNLYTYIVSRHIHRFWIEISTLWVFSLKKGSLIQKCLYWRVVILSIRSSFNIFLYSRMLKKYSNKLRSILMDSMTDCNSLRLRSWAWHTWVQAIGPIIFRCFQIENTFVCVLIQLYLN